MLIAIPQLYPANCSCRVESAHVNWFRNARDSYAFRILPDGIMGWPFHNRLILPISADIERIMVKLRSAELVVGTVSAVDHRPFSICFLQKIQKHLKAVLKLFPGLSIVTFKIKPICTASICFLKFSN